MKPEITKETLKQHLRYAWWKYVVLFFAASFGVMILYTVTAPRIPAEKTVDWYIATTGVPELTQEYVDHVRATEMSDMEQMDVLYLMQTPAYYETLLSTYLGSFMGDVYLLEKDEFQIYAAQGTFIPLEGYTDLVATAEAAGAQLDKGWRTYVNEDPDLQETHLYGIPAAAFTGLGRFMGGFQEYYFCIPIGGGNLDNSVRFLNILLRDTSPAATEE